MIETLVHPRKIKTKTPTCPLCVLTACGQWPRLDSPLIYMAQNNLNSLRPSDPIWLQILVITYFFQQAITVSGSNEHVNSNETVKYWYSAQLCCCFISLENYNFLQEKILPTRYSYIFKLFLIFTPVSSTSSGRNLFLPGSHHSFWFHFPWKEWQ